MPFRRRYIGSLSRRAAARSPHARSEMMSVARARSWGHPPPALSERIAGLEWERIAANLEAEGCVVIGGMCSADECRSLSESYPADELFRSRIVMSRHGFGRGEYKYFAYPLPPVIAALRTALYAPLAEIANRWNRALRVDVRYPAAHAEFLE